MKKLTKSSCSSRAVSFSGTELTESTITIIKNSGEKAAFDVYIGFLKVFHRYAIDFSVPNELGLSTSISYSSSTVGIKVKNIQFHDNEIVISLEYICELKEGVVTESFHITCDKTDRKLKLILHMEILGKNQGTPSLKSGVKCIERICSDESDYSDFPS